MIQMITYNNPINNIEESLIINLESIYMDYNKWQIDLYLLNTKDLYDILNDFLKDLDCTRLYKSGRPMMTTYSQYKIIIAEFLKVLNKIPGYSIYNEYIDKLINRHEENIAFEFNNPIVKKKPNNSKKQRERPNKWIKAITNDIFTGEERYVYENLKTGEIITSGNPNLLDELNSPKKKEKKQKITQPKIISTEGIIFNFKLK